MSRQEAIFGHFQTLNYTEFLRYACGVIWINQSLPSISFDQWHSLHFALT